MNNPLPGMNPYFEEQWPDVHATFLVGIRNQLQPRLPSDLAAEINRHAALTVEGKDKSYYPDISLHETPPAYTAATWSPAGTGGIALAEPEIIVGDPLPERWVEIREVTGRLVTVIEVLSPKNKEGEGAAEYRRKRNDFLRAGVNVVELDLLRSGGFVLAVNPRLLRRRAGRPYTICATRAPVDDGPVRHAVWCAGLREPLPNITVPLRPGEPPVPLELQPLVDQAWRDGGLWKRRYPHDPEPPLPEEDRVWFDGRLRAAGLR
jgi:hypothetical protein